MKILTPLYWLTQILLLFTAGVLGLGSILLAAPESQTAWQLWSRYQITQAQAQEMSVVPGGLALLLLIASLVLYLQHRALKGQ